MAVRFNPTKWRLMLEQYVRGAKTAHLFAGDGLSPATLVEISGGGYRPHELLGGRWDVQDRGAIAVATYPILRWVFQGALEMPVKGYYVADAQGAVVWWEPYPDPPVDIRRRGEEIAVEMIVETDLEN